MLASNPTLPKDTRTMVFNSRWAVREMFADVLSDKLQRAVGQEHNGTELLVFEGERYPDLPSATRARFLSNPAFGAKDPTST